MADRLKELRELVKVATLNGRAGGSTKCLVNMVDLAALLDVVEAAQTALARLDGGDGDG